MGAILAIEGAAYGAVIRNAAEQCSARPRLNSVWAEVICGSSTASTSNLRHQNGIALKII